MTSSGAIVLAVAAIVVGLVLLRFAKQIALLLLRMGLVGTAAILGLALLSQVGSARHTASVSDFWPTVSIMILVVLLLVAVVVIGYLTLRLRMESRKWLPGPEARWGQANRPRWEEISAALYPPLLYGPPYPQQQYPSPQGLPTFYVLEDPGEDDTEDVLWEDVWW